MKKKEYLKPDIELIPYKEPLMELGGSAGGDIGLSKENDTFFKEDEEDDELWSDFVPFEEEE